MRAPTGTFQIPRGDDVNLRFKFTDRNGERFTPQGATEIRFSMKSCRTEATTTLCWIEGHDVMVHLTPVETALTGSYKADIQFSFTDSLDIPQIWTPWIGVIDIIEDVS